MFKAICRTILPRPWLPSIFCPNFLRERVKRRTRLQVMAGPFQGLRYIEQSHASVLVPKLIGIYEHELHATLRSIQRMGFSRVIDIGAAEGYYAVGLATTFGRRARVTAFETETSARELLGKLAELNGVTDRLAIKGHCDANALREAMEDGRDTLVLCDIEGAEIEVLEPERIPALRNAHILVELHRSRVPNIEQLMRERFTKSHHITAIQQEFRRAEDYPFREFPVGLFPRVYIENEVTEFRQPWEERMTWLWMTPAGQAVPKDARAIAADVVQACETRDPGPRRPRA